MIKDEAKRLHFANRPRETELANNLGEAFDVTSGSIESGQTIWICQPNQQTADRFGFTQELLLVYTSHSKPDARIITSVNTIIKESSLRSRLDKLVVLIVHETEYDNIKDILESEKDIVAVSIPAKSLADKQRGSFFVRSQIAAHIGQYDLFGKSSPIRHDRYFYGRSKIVQEITSRAISANEHSGLFGLRKTGKTSVLFAVQRRLEETKTICEYIDCQTPGVYGGRWWALLNQISTRLIDAFNKRMANEDLKLREYLSEAAATEFMKTVKSIIAHEDIDQIVLLMDEIEFITPDISNTLGMHWDVDFQPFWQTIRATSQETGGKFTFIVAGVNPYSVETPSFKSAPNPIFQLAPAYYLEPLSESSVRDMVRTIGKVSGLNFEEECFSYLCSTYGGHPYLIRLACSVVSMRKGPAPATGKIDIKADDFIKSRSSIKTRLGEPIKDILLSLVWWYPSEYEALQILATDSEFAEEYIEKTPELKERFHKYGLLRNDYKTFNILDMKDYLSEKGKDYEKVISPFRRSDLPPDLLPTVPNLEDLAKLYEKRTSIEINLRKFILLVLGFLTAFDDAKIASKIVSSFPPKSDKSQLFIGRRPQDAINELYLSDLQFIFISNWQHFIPYFGQKPDRFKMNMDTINIARRNDAHAKPLTNSEKENFLNSYSWIENILSKVPGLIQ